MKIGKFLKVEKSLDADIYYLYNTKTGVYLGYIEFCDSWNTYVFNPESLTFYGPYCLADISAFINVLNSKKALDDDKI